MKTSKKKAGRTRSILWWPLFLLPIIISALALIFFLPEATYYVLLGSATATGIFLLSWFLFWKKNFSERMLFFAQSFNEIQTSQLENCSTAAALINSDYEIIWCNKNFKDAFALSDGTNIEKFSEDLIYEIDELFADENYKAKDVMYKHGDKTYRIESKLTEDFVTVWFNDETDLARKEQTLHDMSPVVAIAYFDNYEETADRLDEMQSSILLASVQKLISEYFSSYGAIITAVDRTKFAIFFDNKILEKLREDRFSILESVKTCSSVSREVPTLSIGVGASGRDITEDLKLAREAMDLCLGRGGDQAIVKLPDTSTMYGGKTERQEKLTRIKARITAGRIKETLDTVRTVLVMGHKNPDADAIGASIGMYRIARVLGKDAHIVLSEVPDSVRPIYDNVMDYAEPEEKIFITKKEAYEYCHDDTAVIVVDVNRPNIVEAMDIVEKIKTRIVIDHHRLSEQRIEDTTLSYVDTSFSSASEMICEIIQYISKEMYLTKADAEALYAGIVIDSDNFHIKTGAKTFETAAYLRRLGADITDVRKMLRDSFDEVLAKNRAVAAATIHKKYYAFGSCDSKELKNPTVVAAQIANELLEIKGIKASFVFAPFDGKIYISARSIDEVNVQLVMEKLGGGGHLSVAGAQLPGCSLEEAIEKTKQAIEKMEAEGEI